jgi:CubicO group peptidase (beta-lactamase class C family)
MKLNDLSEVIPHLILSGLVLFCGGCNLTDDHVQKVFPGKSWDESSPETQGVDPLSLDSALDYFSSHSGGVGTDEMVIVRNGYVIWKGPAAGNSHPVYSCTKTFTSTVLGILATRGELDVDDLAVDYFPELDDGGEGQEAYQKIRFRDLATMTGGYAGIATDCWSLHLEGLHNESYACTQQYVIPGKPQYVPRTRWSYRDPNVHILGYILTKIAGEPLENVFRSGVADRIGMINWDWSDYGKKGGIRFNNPAGTPNRDEAIERNDVQGGVWTTALDLARFGLLYLNNGNWDGEQLLDSSFAETALSNQVPVELSSNGFDLAGRYGFYWWTNGIRKDGTRPWPSVPPKAASAHGRGRNFCFVIPEWDMVIVRMSPRSVSAVPKHGDELWEGFFARLTKGID